MGKAPAEPCYALRAHNGSYQILFVKSQRFKVFCQAFCKKLAAGGSRSPDKSQFILHFMKISVYLLCVLFGDTLNLCDRVGVGFFEGGKSTESREQCRRL